MENMLPVYNDEQRARAERMLAMHIAMAKDYYDDGAAAAWQTVLELSQAHSRISTLRVAIYRAYEQEGERAIALAKTSPSYRPLESQTAKIHALFTHWLYLCRYRETV